jgi:hypothetical protein
MKNTEDRRDYLFHYKHGITRDEAIKILEEQGGCKICGEDLLEANSQWYTDHDHNCCVQNRSCENCRRGILCRACNLMLGFARDNKQVLEQAVRYLEEYERGKDGNSK